MSTNFILTDEQSSNPDSQLAFDFSSVPETAEKTAGAVQLAIPNADNQNVSIPHLNTPDNFVRNFTAISGDFESDTVEAGWHGNEFRTMLAAMYYMNEHQIITSDCVWYGKNGESCNYTLFDPDADC